MTSPGKRGNPLNTAKTGFTEKPEYMHDDYDRKRNLSMTEWKQSKAKM
jgi:hypothetical protein